MSCYWSKIVNKLKSGSAELRHDIIYIMIIMSTKKKKKKKLEREITHEHLRGNRKVSLFISDGFRHDDGWS